MKNGQTGFYRGIVVKHLKNGLLKVFIPGVYKDEYQTQPDKLPDAELAAPLAAGGADGNGVFSYPDINAIVWCFFMNDDVNYPVVFAQTLGSASARMSWNKASKEIKENSDGTVSGNATAHFIKAGKTSILMHEGGMIDINVADSGYVKIDKAGNVFIENSSTLQLTAKTINISAQDQLDISGESVNIRSRSGGTRLDSEKAIVSQSSSKITVTDNHKELV